MKRPSSFLEFDLESTYMPGFDLSDVLLYQIAMPLPTEPGPKSDDTYPWAEELLMDFYMKFQLSSLKNKNTRWILVNHLQKP